jgi:glycosyltransferase involved in cell wall biosynthesis
MAEITPPFFSVCIETHNREKTIQRVLECILMQTCLDFELIVVDNGSTDNTLSLIQETLGNVDIVSIKIIKEAKKINDIEGWNAPIRFASGEFIIVCEGDDYFNPEHFERAKEILQNNPTVGIYEASTKSIHSKSPDQITKYTSESMLKKLYQLQWCPVPSATIFKRVNHKSEEKFLFHEINVYAGEYLLYESVLQDGWEVIVNYSYFAVERGVGFYLKTDFHLQDVILFRSRSIDKLSLDELKRVNLDISSLAIHYFLINLFHRKFTRNLIRIVRELENNKLEICGILFKQIRIVVPEESKKKLFKLRNGVKIASKHFFRY